MEAISSSLIQSIFYANFSRDSFKTQTIVWIDPKMFISNTSSYFLIPNMNHALQNILNFKKNRYLLNMGPNSGDSLIILNSFWKNSLAVRILNLQ